MNTIFHDLVIKSNKEKLFYAITTEDGLNAWWTLKSKGNCSIGEEYQFYFSEAYDWYGRIDKLKLFELVEFKMVKAGSDWMDTVLSFELIDQDSEHTKLRFEHRGWIEINDHFRRTSYCWALYLHCLKKYIEDKVIYPYGERTSLNLSIKKKVI